VDNRHLLPNEFDLLLDGDVGFGLTPLKAHLRVCAECRAEFADRRQLVQFLEELPHLAPAPMFADRVMSRVHVFEPWYITLGDTIRSLVPTSRPARVLAGLAGVMTALVVSVIGMLLVTRRDAAIFGLELALDRGRSALLGLMSGAVRTVFGDGALGAMASAGPEGVLLGLAVVLVSLVTAIALLRSATVVSRRQRL
jgi:hypothetical protein